MTGPDARNAGETTLGTLTRILIGAFNVLDGEMQAARAEVARGLRGMVRGAALLIVAAVFGLVCLNTAAGAAVFALVGLGLAPTWAGAAVALALLVIAVALALWGVALLNPKNLIPQRSLSRLRGDVETLKSMVIPDADQKLHPETDPQPQPDRSAA